MNDPVPPATFADFVIMVVASERRRGTGPKVRLILISHCHVLLTRIAINIGTLDPLLVADENEYEIEEMNAAGVCVSTCEW